MAEPTSKGLPVDAAESEAQPVAPELTIGGVAVLQKGEEVSQAEFEARAGKGWASAFERARKKLGL